MTKRKYGAISDLSASKTSTASVARLISKISFRSGISKYTVHLGKEFRRCCSSQSLLRAA